MNEYSLNKTSHLLILITLVVLSFFLLKPILIPILLGIILAYIFNPLYIQLNKVIKSKNIAVTIICIFLMLLIILPIWFLTPIAINQSIRIYIVSQNIDFVTPLKNIFPSLFASEEFSREVGSIIHSFVLRTTNSLMNSLAKLISNFVEWSLKLFVVFFTFYFTLRDKEIIVNYLKSLSPFSKELEKEFLEKTNSITKAVLYGQVIIGIIQGLIIGVGFFIFGIPNALILTLLAILAGIFPLIGTTIIWIPTVVYLFVIGDIFSAIGIIFFGVLSNIADNFIRPAFVSKRTKLHPVLIFLGMVGGFFLFGLIGFILGPLILAYLFLILELYRHKNF